MLSRKLIASSAILLGALSSQAFAWSIDGVVKSKISGRTLSGVTINTFNFGGFETTSAADGTFHLSSDGTTAIASPKASNVALHMEGNTLTIYNADARSLSVSVINSLGKVLKKNSIENVQGIVSLDLGKLAKSKVYPRQRRQPQQHLYGDRQGLCEGSQERRRFAADAPVCNGRLRQQDIPDDARNRNGRNHRNGKTRRNNFFQLGKRRTTEIFQLC